MYHKLLKVGIQLTPCDLDQMLAISKHSAQELFT